MCIQFSVLKKNKKLNCTALKCQYDSSSYQKLTSNTGLSHKGLVPFLTEARLVKAAIFKEPGLVHPSIQLEI